MEQSRITLFICFAFGIIAALVSVASVSTAFNKHPDEHGHFFAADYYRTHSIPPKIGTEMTNRYSIFGNSYLDELGINYFIAGKASLVLDAFTNSKLQSIRLVNVAFLLLVLFFALMKVRKNFRSVAVFIPILLTPQLWYVFAYINSDAFAFTCSILLASDLCDFLLLDERVETSNASKWLQYRIGALLGILAISKLNYLSFVGFTGLVLLNKSIRTVEPISIKNIMEGVKRVIIPIMVVAMFVISIRLGCDWAVNGSKRLEIEQVREQFAEYPYKLSTAINHPQDSYYGNYLKQKGVSYRDIFRAPWNWGKISFESFVGVYGWMNIFENNEYYLTFFLLYSLLVGIILLQLFKIGSVTAFFIMLFGVFGALANILASTQYSWAVGFQAQGRYLFPILSMLGLIVSTTKVYELRAFWIMVGTIFLLGLHSFLFTVLASSYFLI